MRRAQQLRQAGRLRAGLAPPTRAGAPVMGALLAAITRAMKPRHRFAEHVGEVQIILVAPDLAALFAEAGRALAEVMVGDVLPELDAAAETVSVRAHDREALLVAWLDELIFRSETNNRVYTSFVIDRISDREIHAAIAGFEPAQLRTQVKAATMHGLRIDEGKDGMTATVILDV